MRRTFVDVVLRGRVSQASGNHRAPPHRLPYNGLAVYEVQLVREFRKSRPADDVIQLGLCSLEDMRMRDHCEDERGDCVGSGIGTLRERRQEIRNPQSIPFVITSRQVETYSAEHGAR